MNQSDHKAKLDKLVKDYNENGFAVFENFLSNDEVEALRNETKRLVRHCREEGNKPAIFSNELNMKSQYFLDSGHKICYFFEKNAVDFDTLELKLPEDQSMAKIAHALHRYNDTFHKITTSEKVQAVFKVIDYREPTVIQSMVIFKNPHVGGEYTPHQDASFLYARPCYVAGIWLALDDATPENGCLEFVPGSHKETLYRRLMRADDPKDGEDLLYWTDKPFEVDEHKFVKVPVKRGDLVLIHGMVIHRSAANKSDKPRWAYTFHSYDKSRTVYSNKSWLQYNEETFIPIYTDPAKRHN